MSGREVDFPDKDLPLREDVSLLGALVGEVVREQAGEAVFRCVEDVRAAAIRRREGNRDAEEELCRLLQPAPPCSAPQLVEAFSTYFQVVNLAEKMHRIRRRRDYLRAGQAQRESLEDTARRLHDAGFGLGQVESLLADLLLEPVLTSHPTEAVRRTILEKEQRMARCLVARMNPSKTPPEERAALGRIRAEITAAWQTVAHPTQRPTVGEEREHVLFYLTDVIYRIVPPFYEALKEALERVYGPAARESRIPTVLRFASWVGGDMDGNPGVSAETISATLERHRALVLRLYWREVQALAGRLSQSLSRVSVSADVVERVEEYRKLFPDAYAAIAGRHRDMPYRVLLRLMAARLEATAADRREGYRDAAELRADLGLIDHSLAENRGARAGLFAVRRALRRVDTFGFHLATLDVRQDALVHREVAGRLLGDAGWLRRPSQERTERLRRVLQLGERPAGEADDLARRTLEVFATIARSSGRFGPQAIGPYIISMAQGADDVLTVLVLARWGGLAPASGAVPLDVAPLFETVADLEAAPEILRQLMTDPLYRAHLRERGDRQVIMVGYSDSNKDGGLAASRWALQRAQQAVLQSLQPAAVEPTIFHGRGGTVGRGGGKTHRAVLAAPRGSVRGRLRVTEQGEVIHEKYGLRGIALRSLEQAFGAMVLATALSAEEDRREAQWRQMMDLIARSSRGAYRALVYETPGFWQYFRGATPIDVIERMRIGSRPSSRRTGRGIEDLRAIPWVFAWMQSRHLLPGWFGLGTGLEAAVQRHSEHEVAEMVREWPFLRTMVDDAEMVLAKADLDIAARYAELAGAVRREIFPLIRAEYERTMELVLRLKGTSELLDEDVTLQRSIRLRNPYVDPMSLLQVGLLEKWRQAGRPDDPQDEVFAALLASVNGIALGLGNTG